MFELPLALCTVMLLELVVPASEPPEHGAALRKVLHELIGKALRGAPENTRIGVDSSGAAVVCFMGDPEEALRAALFIRDLVSQRYGSRTSMRIVLNMGPVRVTASKDRIRVIGKGVQHAAQVKGHCRPGDVVVSRSYHQLLLQLNPDTERLFQRHGPNEDRPVEMYAVIAAADSQRAGAASVIVTRPAPLPEGKVLDAEAVQAIEATLTGAIGPLAHILVRKAERSARSLQALRETLAAAIQNPQRRELFRLGKPAATATGQHGRDAPAPAISVTASRVPPRPDATRQLDIAPAELAIIARTLQRFIGPMAQPLMQREIDFCVQFGDFVDAVAGSIGHPQQREVFLQALQRALPERRI